MIASHLSLKVVEVLSPSDIECATIIVECVSYRVIISVVYFVTDTPVEIVKKYCAFLINLGSTVKNCRFLLLGDFNLPGISWINERTGMRTVGDLPLISQRDILQTLLYNFNFIGLSQISCFTNSVGNYLDLFFTDLEGVDQEVSLEPYLNTDFYHLPIELSVNVGAVRSSMDSEEKFMDFKSADYRNINTCLSKIKWSEVFSDGENDVNSFVNSFYTLLYDIIDSNVQCRTVFKPKFPRWFSHETRSCILEKNYYHALKKESGSSLFCDEFRKLRSKCKCLVARDERAYIEKVEKSINSDPKEFWNYAKTLGTRNVGVPAQMRDGELELDDGSMIVNAFAKFFGDVYKTSSLPDPSFVCGSNVCMNDIVITIADVEAELRRLVGDTKSGPDRIPSFFLRKCAHHLAEPLCQLFNFSLREGCFPNKWKDSFIVPTHKSGDREEIVNYRPVVRDSAIPRMLDAIVAKK